MTSKIIRMTIFSVVFVSLLSYSFSINNFSIESNIKYDYNVKHFYANHAFAQELKWSEFNDSSTNINTVIPSNWEIIKGKKEDNMGQSSNVTILKSPKENTADIFQENIVISTIKSEFNPSEGKNIDIKDIIEKLDIGNLDLGSENISTIQISTDKQNAGKNNNNLTAQSISYNFNNSGIMFKTEQVFIIGKNSFYVISLLAEQESFNQYKLILDEILNNIKLIE